MTRNEVERPSTASYVIAVYDEGTAFVFAGSNRTRPLRFFAFTINWGVR